MDKSRVSRNHFADQGDSLNSRSPPSFDKLTLKPHISYNRFMCGRFNDHLPKMHGWADLIHDWSPEAIGVHPSYNVTPSRLVAALPIEGAAIAPATAMRWGMIPNWSKVFESSYATFNARSESVADKPTFRHAWKNAQRCIIPMAGYYEWRALDVAAATSSKQALYITDRNNGVMLAAGLYEPWGDAGKISCTMLTKPASEELHNIHPRMPILLSRETLSLWVNQTNQQLEQWLKQAEHPDLVYWPVSNAVGNVKNDAPQLIEPVDA